jgi:hypothetical protein
MKFRAGRSFGRGLRVALIVCGIAVLAAGAVDVYTPDAPVSSDRRESDDSDRQALGSADSRSFETTLAAPEVE